LQGRYEIKHVEITTTLVRDAEGRAAQVVGVSRDATARVEAQRALAESEASRPCAGARSGSGPSSSGRPT